MQTLICLAPIAATYERYRTTIITACQSLRYLHLLEMFADLDAGRIAFFVYLQIDDAGNWALVRRVVWQFFVVVFYVCLAVKDGEKLTNAVENLLSLSPAMVQYKFQKEGVIMKSEQLDVRTNMEQQDESPIDHYLSQPENHQHKQAPKGALLFP